MSDYDTTEKEVTDSEVEQAGAFGYDAKGRCHRYHPVRARIIVTVDGDVVHVEELARERVPEWIAYVAETVGWIDQWWANDDSLDSMQRHQAAKAQAADIAYETAKQEVAD